MVSNIAYEVKLSVRKAIGSKIFTFGLSQVRAGIHPFSFVST